VKYIIVSSESGLPCAVIFNEALTHKDVAGNMKVLSVGFCKISKENSPMISVETFGHSESLNMANKLGDRLYIELALNH